MNNFLTCQYYGCYGNLLYNPTKNYFECNACGFRTSNKIKSILYKKFGDISFTLELVSLTKFSLNFHLSTTKIKNSEHFITFIDSFLSKFKPRYIKQTNISTWIFIIQYYDEISRLIKQHGFKIIEIPKSTLISINNLSNYKDDSNLFYSNLSKKFKNLLLPFQKTGILFGLRRGGRCFIADEMGTGKTLQSLSIAYCYRKEWPLLIITPASLRMMWANEIEKWFPRILPSNLQLITSANKTIDFHKQITITSYTMLSHLIKEFMKHEFKVIIVDESHKLRSTYRFEKLSKICKAALKVLSFSKRIILLSGTPCITKPFNLYFQINALRPGIIGNSEEFAKNYCDLKLTKRKGKTVYDVSGGKRLDELRLLLHSLVMIRRIKKNVMNELPPLFRQICLIDIRNVSKDIISNYRHNNEYDSKMSMEQKLGIKKLDEVLKFVRNIINGVDKFTKIVIFAHHRKVIAGIQQHIESLKIQYILIQGEVLPEERTKFIIKFNQFDVVRIAIVSITAGNIGFDLSTAKIVIFAELPKTFSDLRQAESRLHRRNQKNCVNVYYIIAKNTFEEKRWRNLRIQLEKTSQLLNEKKEQEKLSINSINYLSKNLLEDFLSSLSKTRMKYSNKKLPTIPPTKIDKFKTKSLTPKKINKRLLFNKSFSEPKILPSKYRRKKIDSSFILKYFNDTNFNKSKNISYMKDFKNNIKSLFFMVSKYSNKVYIFLTRENKSFINEYFYVDDILSGYKYMQNLPLIISPFYNKSNFKIAVYFAKKWKSLRKVFSNRLINTNIPWNFSIQPSKRKTKCFRRALDKKSILNNTKLKKNQEIKLVTYKIGKNKNSKVILNHQYQKFDELGNPFCLNCDKVYTDKMIRINFSSFFCSNSCSNLFNLKANPVSARKQLFNIENGICQNCNEDIRNLYLSLYNLSATQRFRRLTSINSFKVLSKERIENICNKVNFTEGLLWNADHIIPVQFGGGQCSLENFQTLCIGCHYTKTNMQRKNSARIK